ncbi:MAG TPA_asm: putative Bacon (Bacteroidetes-Associated Carbohydrate-binding) domain containing protein [Carjivirus communis]|uniref:Bacon (Bacteroidetes-Associated Carbohydrate-binding) domain containing protein n=1 Tax=Carjivirus communis TaxID=2955582 RepID=A0A348JCT6_9CAUD|nr:MAG: putative Bacon (Bacteroidetes-Associated Carbohydrate-binding) domain containing protein [Carjivirus communis]DAB41581.1 MAG TPA_asm: putative Bacon (Bacteroidetes-Associated Carbohydrate-binding) domain containing protein [Carjivirus communis]
MAIYQGAIGIHNIKLGSIDVFEIYQGSKLVYPENTEITITFKLNVSGTVTINGYTPVISENNTKFVFTIPVKTDYTAIVTAEHYKPQTISGNSGYLPITHNVELEWEEQFISYTVTFPTDGVKVLFDGIEKGVITNGKLVVLIDDTEAKDSYTVTFKGSKASTYDTSTLIVVNSSIANTGGSYDLKLPTSSVKSGYKRTDYASSTGSITKGSTYAGTWIETVVNLTASFTSSTTLGSISNNVLTIPNNESTNTKSGTLTVTFTLENSQTKQASGALNQAAGAKVYTNWVLDLQTDGTSVEAKGGTRTVTANIARRTYKWNNTGTVYSETATPTLSISGSASLSGNQIKFTSNESVSARSATLTASYVGLSKTVTITQQAGAKVYSAWSAWTVSISASTQTIAASGGSSTITTNASRSRTWTWNGVGTTHTDTETATPTLSGSAGGFTLSGKTVTASNNTTTNSRSITITATSNSVSKSITITQSAGAKVYGNWSSWTINISADKTSIGATGGTATISTSASRTRSYTWNGVAGSGGTETGNGSPTLSKVSGSGNWTSPKVTYGNNTSTSGKSTVIRATIDSTTKDITISQSAGAKQYSAWSAWTVNISNSGNVAASGGSSNITTSASRTRTWTWNGVNGSGGTETGTGTPTLSKISGAGSFASNKVTYDNNTSTSVRSTVIRATMDSVTKDTTVTQNAGSKTYSSWGAWSISLSANVTTIAAAGGNATLSTSATRNRTWQWNGTGTTYTENASGSPTLSKVNGAASLSGSTVSYGNNTSTSSRSSVFRATIDSATKDITISQSAGSKSYGSWSSWSVYCNASSYTVAASGGSVTIYYGASRSRTWTWNGVAGSGGTETENATPSISTGSGGGTLSGSTLSYSNNTSTSVRRTRVTANYNGAINFCDIEQRAGSKVYGSWGAWSVSISASPTNIAAAGGSSTITCNAVRSRQYTWNGVGQNFPETENGNPTLSKSGDGTLSGTTSGSKLTYGNRTATTSRSTTVTATYNGVSKSINITQSAGAKSYGAKVYHTKYYGTNPDGSGLDFTGYPYTNEIDTVADANTISISVYYRLYTTQLWTWNGVAGSGGTETVYYNPDYVNVTNKVNCDVSVANAFNYASMIIITFKLSANDSNTAREYKIEWNWLNHNVITKGTQRANPVRGRLVIKNDYFTSQNVALSIYLDSENVDLIYKGEASYNDIKKTPIGVYVYIPTNTAIMNAGKLQFWFENKDGDGSKYTCTLSSVSTPMNNVSVSNSNNIISVTANTTTSSFTILCQFTMTSNSTLFNVRVLIEP